MTRSRAKYIAAWLSTPFERKAYHRLLGEVLPPWYMGFSYHDYMSRTEVFHVMPFNWLARWGQELHYWWMKHVQCRRNPRDVQFWRELGRQQAAIWKDYYATIEREKQSWYQLGVDVGRSLAEAGK